MDFITDLSLISVALADVSLVFPVLKKFLTVQLNKEREQA
jgi:hypothetical protein